MTIVKMDPLSCEARQYSTQAQPSSDEETDDVHLCLRCQTSISGLENYVAHRKPKLCRKKKFKAASVEEGRHDRGSGDDEEYVSSANDFFHYFQLQQRSPGSSRNATNSSPTDSGQQQQLFPSNLVQNLDVSSITRRHSDQLASKSKVSDDLNSGSTRSQLSQNLCQMPGNLTRTSPNTPLFSPAKLDYDNESSRFQEILEPGPEIDIARLRRPSADQAAVFMESLGLYVNTKIASKDVPVMSPRKDSNSNAKAGFSSPSRNAREEFWDENLLLWPAGHEMEQVFMGSGAASFEHLSRHKVGKPSLLSFMRHSSDKQKGQNIMDGTSSFRSFAMSPSQNDFMRQIDLMNVSSLGVESAGENADVANPAAQNRWKLWNPEQESDDLWHDVLSQSDLYFEEPSQQSGPPPGGLLIVANSVMPEKSNLPVLPTQPPAHHCQVCDRTLASEDLLEKHQQSELHFKRLTAVAVDSQTLGKRSRRKNRKYSYDLDSETSPKKSQVTTGTKENDTNTIVIVCPTCDSLTNSWQFGKHLLSHYHLNHSKVSKNHSSSHNLIFDHIEDIVRQCPYQCDICRFYCNWDHEFVSHWESNHKDDSEESKAFWCSFCAQTCCSGAEMLAHLRSEKHREIVVAISRVVPISIRQISRVKCNICDKMFRLKFSLKKHMLLKHKNASFELIDHDKLRCDDCAFVTCSYRSFTSHTFLAHPEKRSKYNCFVCRLQFHSKKVSETHRRTLEHRLKVKTKRLDETRTKCEFCDHESESLLSLKLHIREKHVDLMSQCGICGDKFSLPQDLTSHVKGKCKPEGAKFEGQFFCGEDLCKFSCESVNMILFHQALRHHNQSMREHNEFACNICGKTFTRSKLWEHVRIHGDAHRCKECYRIFTSLSRLKDHLEHAHTDSESNAFKGSKVFLCNKCDYSSLKKRLLILHERRTHFATKECEKCGQVLNSFKSYHEHAKLHDKSEIDLKRHKCPEAGCSYRSKTAYDLKSHAMIHLSRDNVAGLKCQKCDFRCKRVSELNRHERNHHAKAAKIFSCENCNYVSNSHQHLQRHQQTHLREAETFQCRFCDHFSFSVDSLRKHILKTGRHPNSSVYYCDYCSFDTNALQEFKCHVYEHHSNMFPNTLSALQYIKSYFAKEVK